MKRKYDIDLVISVLLCSTIWYKCSIDDQYLFFFSHQFNMRHVDRMFSKCERVVMRVLPYNEPSKTQS